MTKYRIEEVFDALPEVADLDKPQAMIEGWGTATHIITAIRMQRSNVNNNLAKLHLLERAHIHDWTGANSCTPVWVRGAGENKPRPVLTIEAEAARQRRYNEARRNADKEVRVQPGRALETTRATIERVKATGPRHWWATLEDAQGDQP